MPAIIEQLMCMLKRQCNHDHREWFVEIIDDNLGPVYWTVFERCLHEANILLMSPEVISRLLSDLHNRAWEEAVKQFEDAYRFASIMTGQFPGYQQTLLVTWARYAQEASRRFTFVHPVVSHISGADVLSEVADGLVERGD